MIEQTSLAVGLVTFILGVILVFLGVRSRATISTRFGSVAGPTWFILVVLGALLAVLGPLIPLIVAHLI